MLLLWDLVVLAARAARAVQAATARVMGKVLGLVLLARVVVQVLQGGLVKVILIFQPTNPDKIALIGMGPYIFQETAVLVVQVATAVQVATVGVLVLLVLLVLLVRLVVQEVRVPAVLNQSTQVRGSKKQLLVVLVRLVRLVRLVVLVVVLGTHFYRVLHVLLLIMARHKAALHDGKGADGYMQKLRVA